MAHHHHIIMEHQEPILQEDQGITHIHMDQQLDNKWLIKKELEQVWQQDLLLVVVCNCCAAAVFDSSIFHK